MLKKFWSRVVGSATTEEAPGNQSRESEPTVAGGTVQPLQSTDRVSIRDLTSDQLNTLKRLRGEEYISANSDIAREQFELLDILAKDNPTSSSRDSETNQPAQVIFSTGVQTARITPPSGSTGVPLSELSGLERAALYRLMGRQYLETIDEISAAQLTVLRQFSAIDWDSADRNSWKSEYQAHHSVVAREMAPRQPLQRVDKPQDETTDPTSVLLRQSHNPSNQYRAITAPDSEDPSSSRPVGWEGALNAEQGRLFDYVEATSRNLFITGRAGSGKSHLLRHIVENSRKSIVVAAPTGVAAMNAGGATLHSVFKLKIGFQSKELIEEAYFRLRNEHGLVLRKMDMLIIDEVSMVHADVMSAIDKLLRRIRETDSPFGGAQIILFGDPYQLDPVVREKALRQWYSDVLGSPFFFSSPEWKFGGFAKLEMQGSLRQNESDFLEALDAIRSGTAKSSHIDYINERVMAEPLIPVNGVVRLAGTNSAVDSYNRIRLNGIRSPEFTYVGVREGDFEEDTAKLPAPEHLHLRVGAQVMMLQNDFSKRWVNGSMATIAELDSESVHIEIEDSIHEVGIAKWDKIKHRYNRMEATIKQEVSASYRQYPVALGWARTIHKSQGQTYDKCAIDLGRGMFAYGQAYVALSRSRSHQGLYLNQPLMHEDVLVADPVKDFMSDLVPATSLPAKVS